MESHHSILFCIVNMNIHAKYFKLFMHKRSVMHIDLLQLALPKTRPVELKSTEKYVMWKFSQRYMRLMFSEFTLCSIYTSKTVVLEHLYGCIHVECGCSVKMCMHKYSRTQFMYEIVFKARHNLLKYCQPFGVFGALP